MYMKIILFAMIIGVSCAIRETRRHLPLSMTGMDINVKCDPQWRDFWRNAFAAVVPAYHMNKTHWNSIILDVSVPVKDIQRMIAESYDLTEGKK